MSENPYANMSVAQLEARRSEILKKKQQMASGSSSNPYANMSVEELEAKRQAILQKRQKKAPAPEPTFMDRASQFGSGFMHSLGEGALNSQNPEEEMWSPNTYSGQPGEVANSLAPETRDYLKNYIQTQQPSQNADLTERMLHGAGQWIGEGVKMPLVPGWSNAVTNLDRLRAIGRTAGLTAAGGATSGTLQQAGVNPGVADLSAGFLTPLGIGALKKGAYGVGYALSPNMREQAAKAKGEKIARFGFKKSLEGLEEAPTENIGEAISVEHNLKPFAERVESEDAGKAIRDSLSSKKENLENIRKEKTGHLYENLEKAETLHSPSNALNFIREKLKKAKFKQKDILEKFEKELAPSSETHDLPDMKEYSYLKEKNPNAYKEIEDIYNSKKKLQTPGELDYVKQEIDDEISKAVKSGRTNLRNLLLELKEKVKIDLENTPSGLEHAKQYKKYSEPINPLETGAIGNLLKKKNFNKDYVLTDAEIPNIFIGPANVTKGNVEKLLQEIGHDKKTMDSLKKYIRGKVLDHITDAEGNINANQLKRWSEKHKSAFLIDKDLEKSISNLSNAQLFSKNMINNYSKLPLVDALDKVPAKILKKIGRKIVGFDLLIDKVLEMKKSKELGYARDLFENALKDPKAAEALLKPVKELSKTAKISKTLVPYVNAVKPKNHQEKKDQ